MYSCAFKGIKIYRDDWVWASCSPNSMITLCVHLSTVKLGIMLYNNYVNVVIGCSLPNFTWYGDLRPAVLGWRMHTDTMYIYMYCEVVSEILLSNCKRYDGTRGFSMNQLKGKQLSLMFRLDALILFRVTLPLKTTIVVWSKHRWKLFSFKLVYREPP